MVLDPEIGISYGDFAQEHIDDDLVNDLILDRYQSPAVNPGKMQDSFIVKKSP